MHGSSSGGETFYKLSTSEQYLVSLYYTITTITTVGYGDISGVTNLEKVLCIIIMLVGVLTFSFASGALASIFASYDKSNAKLEQQMEMLDSLSIKYEIPLDLYSVIK